MSIELRPYQLESLEAIEKTHIEGIRRQLMALPTGAGKTVIFAELVRERDGRALILCHRDELIAQAKDKLTMIAPDAHVGIVKAERDETDAPIVVASVQTLARARRLQRLEPNFETIVVDEAHHCSGYNSYARILTYLGAFQGDGPLTLGCTATPFRADNHGLSSVFERIVFQRSLVEMIQAGYLCDLRAI